MMKKTQRIKPFFERVLILFVMAIGFLSFGQQSLAFADIQKRVHDKESPYYYERLLYKYRGMPQTIDSIETYHLYYGKNFTEHRLDIYGKDLEEVTKAFKQGQTDEVIRLGEDLHFRDPSNLEVLLLLLQCYEKTENQNKFMLTLQKFRLISATVLTSGTGKDRDSAYLVNTVGEEYVVLNLLQIPFHNYQRSSQLAADGMLDVWKYGNDSIYIKVVGYAPE